MALKSGEVGEMMNCGPLQVLLFDSLIQSCFVKRLVSYSVGLFMVIA